VDPEKKGNFLSEAEAWRGSINETVGEILKSKGINPTPRKIAAFIARAKSLERTTNSRILYRDWEYIQHLTALRHYSRHETSR